MKDTNLQKRPGEHTGRLLAEFTEEILKKTASQVCIRETSTSKISWKYFIFMHVKKKNREYFHLCNLNKHNCIESKKKNFELLLGTELGCEKFTSMPCRFVVLTMSHTVLMRSISLLKQATMSSRLIILAQRGNVGGRSLWLTRGSKPIMMGWSARFTRKTIQHKI